MHLTESDIDTQVKKYWDVREQLLPQEFLEELESTFEGFGMPLGKSPYRYVSSSRTWIWALLKGFS